MNSHLINSKLTFFLPTDSSLNNFNGVSPHKKSKEVKKTMLRLYVVLGCGGVVWKAFMGS